MTPDEMKQLAAAAPEDAGHQVHRAQGREAAGRAAAGVARDRLHRGAGASSGPGSSSRGPPGAAAAYRRCRDAAPAPTHGAAPPAPGAGGAGAARGAAPRAAPRTLKEIKSPMVGTFYKAPEPGAEPYVKVGQPGHRGADGLHHRGDEDHERDRGRGLRRDPRGAASRTPRRSSTARSSSGSIPMADATAARRDRPPLVQLQAGHRRRWSSGTASDLLLKVGRPPDGPRQRRSDGARRCRRSSPRT